MYSYRNPEVVGACHAKTQGFLQKYDDFSQTFKDSHRHALRFGRHAAGRSPPAFFWGGGGPTTVFIYEQVVAGSVTHQKSYTRLAFLSVYIYMLYMNCFLKHAFCTQEMRFIKMYHDLPEPLFLSDEIESSSRSDSDGNGSGRYCQWR